MGPGPGGVERAKSHDRLRKLQLHFGNADGYYRSGCRDIKAAAPGLATGSLRISEIEGTKGLRRLTAAVPEPYQPSARENKRKTLHISHFGINRSNCKSFVINDLI
jgi:hypothetical protein